MARRDVPFPERPTPLPRSEAPTSPRLAALLDGSLVFPLACAASIVLGVALRAWPVLAADFPLNDGGLFYLMTEELRAANYRLPAFTTYNDANIPFAYAPFAFYVAGFLADLGVPLLDVFRFLPLAATCACLVAFLLLARDLLASRTAVVAALLAFALVPRAWVWLVMGGGLTRSFGFLFAILAVREANRLYVRRELRHGALAGLFAGLTALSHLGTAPFAAFSIVVFLVGRGRHREGLLGTGLLGLVAIAVTAPWWGTVMLTHGIEPFLAAQRTGGSFLTPGPVGHAALARLARFGMYTTGEPLFPVVAVLGLSGALASLTAGPVVLPVWWVSTLALEARAGETYATVPLALLAGVGVSRVLLPILRRGSAAVQGVDAPSRAALSDILIARAQRSLVLVVPAFLLAYTLFAVGRPDPEAMGERSYLAHLRPAERVAMRWIARETPPSSRVLVIPPVVWPSERYSEWFPVLAKRPSIVTVQGREWNPDGEFHRIEQMHFRLLDCRDAAAGCLDDWQRETRLDFTHVFVPGPADGGCCGRLRRSLREDGRWLLVYEGQGGQVFARATSD
jgi:hypothetical protein